MKFISSVDKYIAFVISAHYVLFSIYSTVCRSVTKSFLLFLACCDRSYSNDGVENFSWFKRCLIYFRLKTWTRILQAR